MVEEIHGARTNQEIASMAATKSKSNTFICSNPPIFTFIPTARVVPDSFYLFLRISDQLIHQLIKDRKQLDNFTNTTKLEKMCGESLFFF